MASKYRIFSADSHLEISTDRWTPRVPAKYRDRAPRMVKLPDGGDGIIIEGRDVYVLGLAITGKPYEEHKLFGLNYQGSPGAGTPEERIKEQDQDGTIDQLKNSGCPFDTPRPLPLGVIGPRSGLPHIRNKIGYQF